jgi:Domain of unknown function (DUF5134)
MTPAWILDLLAAITLVVAGVSAARLVVARPWQHGSVIVDTDIAHLLMGIAMAGMLVSSLRTLPNTAWEVIFGVMIAWYALRVVRDARANGIRALAGGHCAPHLVHSGAMLFMFLAMTGSGAMAGMAGMSGGAFSTLTTSDATLAFVFALILIGYSIWDLDQLSGRRYSLASARVSLAEVRAGVPAMVGAESAANTAFSGPIPADAVAGTLMDTATGSGAVGGHAVACDTAAIGGGNVAGGSFRQFLLSPAVTVGCRVTMGVVMTFMLVIAI